jgi:hypothetical protein
MPNTPRSALGPHHTHPMPLRASSASKLTVVAVQHRRFKRAELSQGSGGWGSKVCMAWLTRPACVRQQMKERLAFEKPSSEATP